LTKEKEEFLIKALTYECEGRVLYLSVQRRIEGILQSQSYDEGDREWLRELTQMIQSGEWKWIFMDYPIRERYPTLTLSWTSIKII
jgi:hypothetical protein